VRRDFLCGKDHYSGQDYEHRRQWVVDRLAIKFMLVPDFCWALVVWALYQVITRHFTQIPSRNPLLLPFEMGSYFGSLTSQTQFYFYQVSEGGR